jgi:hypothetical protein
MTNARDGRLLEPGKLQSGSPGLESAGSLLGNVPDRAGAVLCGLILQSEFCMGAIEKSAKSHE